MGDLLIRDVPEDILQALTQKAQAASKDRMSYLRDILVKIAAEPLVKERYAIRFYSDEGSAKGIITRRGDDPRSTGGGCDGMSEEEFRVYGKAQDLIRRNGPGDREEAIFLLKTYFNNVFEVPV